MTPPIHTSRTVDLGREDEHVPWAEWFNRSSAMLEHLVKQGQAPQGPRVFRVTLADGRPFAVMSVQKHVARGKCELAPNRWTESASIGPGGAYEPICDVITGYTLIGTAPDGRPTVLSVPPTEIASVECVVLVDVAAAAAQAQQHEKDGDKPFGFAAYKQRLDAPEVEEVEEQTLFSQQAGNGQ